MFVGTGNSSDRGVLKGQIGILEGDCMPNPKSPPCEPKPIAATLLITKPAEVYSDAVLLDSVFVKEEGFYEISLKAGDYSLFIKYNNQVYCSYYQCNPECYCSLVTVYSNATVSVNLNVSKASF